METSWRRGGRNVQDWISLICAVVLFFSPWLFGFSSDEMASRTAWISAIVIAVITIAAIVQFAEWEERVAMVLGLWLIVAPWIVGFAALTHAAATFVVLGVIVALASVSELWQVYHPTATVR
ncbi:MAG: SPW repeat protein [Hyphomicrobiales bacterium]|nr:SPW repeat protein [Hyphomicrobiales bacterium]